jgi:hypothetical protein
MMGNAVSDEYWGSQIQRLINHGKGGLLNVRSVKLFADGMSIHGLHPLTERTADRATLGALGSWGAALLEPYTDKPETSGLMLSTPAKLMGLVEQFWKDGWQVVSIHPVFMNYRLLHIDFGGIERTLYR